MSLTKLAMAVVVAGIGAALLVMAVGCTPQVVTEVVQGAATSCPGSAGTGGAGGKAGAGGSAGHAGAGGSGAAGRGGTGGGMAGTGGGSAGSGGALGGSGGASGAGGAVADGGLDAGGGATGTGGFADGGSAPGLGAHALAFDDVGTLRTPLTTASMSVQPGSLMVVAVGRGNLANFAKPGAVPTDSVGDPAFAQVGTTHAYAHPNEFSGTALYTGTVAGGSMTVSTSQGFSTDNNYDEVTLFAAEVVGGTHVVASAWNEPENAPFTSASVTTTGPAVLVAFWWGEGDSLSSISAGSGFTNLDHELAAADDVDGALAYRVVTEPGTYSVTWTASPAQGAQLWLVAVQ